MSDNIVTTRTMDDRSPVFINVSFLTSDSIACRRYNTKNNIFNCINPTPGELLACVDGQI